MTGVITAAAGRRDGYQVPVALLEADLLEWHITDQYLPEWLKPAVRTMARGSGVKALARLASRNHPQLPAAKVHCSRRLLFTKLAQKLRPSLRSRWSDDQDPLSWSALRLARRHDAAMLLHMGYAHHAFMDEPRERRKRGLVQYHPHIAECARILAEDLKHYPMLSDARDALYVDAMDRSNHEELERADLVVCNSTFTARTCQLLGVESKRLRVIPFGINPPIPPDQHSRRRDESHCHFLFVGSGLHRKGLHHLLEAWGKAGLHHSTLTLVCRSIDPQIRLHFTLDKNVRLCSELSQAELERLYQQADVFVMPSLVEGFGYVYLEALSRGCFCLGTANTGLPDVADATASRCVPAADPSALAEALRELEAQAFSEGFDREAIAAVIKPWTWSHFRHQLVAAAQELVEDR